MFIYYCIIKHLVMGGDAKPPRAILNSVVAKDVTFFKVSQSLFFYFSNSNIDYKCIQE